ncbi:hypothetical protein [Evtepia gabavorous]|uniref:hypothetical protein n=1 Tax=Evtepia gabavorous TaxID=2211183 RepID=UPI003A955D6B
MTLFYLSQEVQQRQAVITAACRCIFFLCMLPIIPKGKEKPRDFQNAIGDRSPNQHPYKEKFSRQTKTENTAHDGQDLSL